MTRAEQDQTLHALAPDGLHEPLGEVFMLWRLQGRLHDPYAGVFDNGLHCAANLAPRSQIRNRRSRWQPSADSVRLRGPQLFLQHAVLFNQERDGVRLLAVHPAGEHREQGLQGEEVGHTVLIDRTWT